MSRTAAIDTIQAKTVPWRGWNTCSPRENWESLYWSAANRKTGWEYTPWRAKALSDPYPDFGGQGSHYLSFLVEKLKPYIDRKYKTDGRREQTGIIGASLGGLISIYAAYLYPDVFGKIVPYPDRFGTKASSILCGRKTPIPD
ncbi:alpha/beta hydrolase-fold protein [Caldibacillus debilis]|uniref:alpha/beta hydrolase-fold protein n=1 Tax=Caldibacillus debilis TaxID=301148 RepID=UPI00217E5A02|nr:alpha/beta hydrolase-fold protein [Caldibacillus debilis]